MGFAHLSWLLQIVVHKTWGLEAVLNRSMLCDAEAWFTMTFAQWYVQCACIVHYK